MLRCWCKVAALATRIEGAFGLDVIELTAGCQ